MCVAAFHAPGTTNSRRQFLRTGAAVATAALVSQLETRHTEAVGEGAPLRAINVENVVDLTHVLGPTTPLLLPLLPQFGLVNLATHEKNGLYANQINVTEHHGTHFDAPIHFYRDGWTTAEVPARMLVAPAVVIGIREKAAAEPDAALTLDDVRAWETSHGRIPEGAAILLHSGWASRIDDEDAMRNVGPDGRMHFPGFSPEVAQFLLAERSIVGIGTDTMSTDMGINEAFEVHKIISPANRWMVESVANLDAIPAAGAHLFVGAPKHVAGSGGPARLIAVW